MGSTQGLFPPSLVYIGPVVSEEKIEMWTKEMDDGCQTTDDKYSMMTKAHLDFSQVYYKHILFAKYRTKWIRHILYSH